MSKSENAHAIVQPMQDLEKSGLNQGSSGNISVHEGDYLLITPTDVTAHDLRSELIMQMKTDALTPDFTGPIGLSSQWPLHRVILQGGRDLNAVVHIRASYVTTLAVVRSHIPAAHNMIVAFGDSEVNYTDYAPYGSSKLSELAVTRLGARDAVLLGNHGTIVTGASMALAMWHMIELEALAKVCYRAQQAGMPVILSDAEIAATVKRFQNYGVQPSQGISQ